MLYYDYKTENTVHNAGFMGGCNRNIKVIRILIEGLTVKQIGGRYEIQT